MKLLHRYGIAMILIFTIQLVPGHAFAQKDVIRIEDNMMIITFDKREPSECANLLKYFGLKWDSLFIYGNIGALAKDGWKLQRLDKTVAQIAKPVNADAKNIDWGKQPIYFQQKNAPQAGTAGYPGPVAYGVNSFKGAPSVFENKQDVTVFLLRGYPSAKKVLVSGNFNNWSTSGAVMKKTDSGWVALMKLKPGKYFYKFLIDEKWLYDGGNNLKEPDGYGSYNSTYFHHNHTFRLTGYTNAKKVIVAGSFNNWSERELQMRRTPSGWQLPLYLSEGTHAYKFIVDNTWTLDPVNKVTRADGTGNVNSFMSMGDSIMIRLNGFTTAKSVILTGNFNGWNPMELTMSRTATGWEIPYVLAAGNYEYKFIVDGKWITDPANPYTIGGKDQINSVMAVKPNYTFVLNRFPEAKEVLLSGSFNNWAEPGYRMVRKSGSWIFPVYLPAGKYTYKYVVDLRWITDPDNQFYEENEYGTGNSVLWIDPSREYLER